MLMPENFEIRDYGVLVIFVNEVEYEFVEKDDFIYSDKKKIILKHHAVINLANNAKIKVGPPVLLSSHDSGSFVFCREAVMNDGTKYCAVGEANGVKDNLWSEYLQQYPAETADNRAYERAVLGIVGLYGKVYGGSEIPFADENLHAAAAEKAPEKQPEEHHTEQSAEKTEKLKPLLRRHRPGICRNGGMISVSGCIRTSSLIRIHLSLRRDSARGKTGRSNICMTITTKAAGILPPGILKTHRAKTSPSRYMPAGAPSKNMASNRRKRLRKQSFLHSPIE